jgi:hypothetical protein
MFFISCLVETMQHLNNGFNKFKVDDSTQVKMLIVQEMWKNSPNHSSVIAKYWIACVSIYDNKSKMQFVSNGSNILKMNSSINVHMLIIEEMKKIINSIQYRCMVLNYYMCFNKLWSV